VDPQVITLTQRTSEQRNALWDFELSGVNFTECRNEGPPREHAPAMVYVTDSESCTTQEHDEPKDQP